jgi:uncharacterized protein (TIRG00374 family)
LILSVALTMLSYLFRATRWQILLGEVQRVSIRRLLSINLVGFAAIYALGRAGELVRPLWLNRRERVPLSAAVSTIVVERFLDAILLIGVFVWALFVIEPPETSSSILAQLKSAAWWIAAVELAAMAAFFVFRSNVKWVVRFIPFPWLAAWAENFAKGLAFLVSGRGIVLVFAHSVLVWIAITLQFWFMMLGMNMVFPLGAATLVMVGSAIGSIAQIPGIGGGFQVGYTLCMTTFLQVPAEQAVATALVATVFSYVPTIAAGGLLMLAQGISVRDLKRSVRNPESEIV